MADDQPTEDAAGSAASAASTFSTQRWSFAALFASAAFLPFEGVHWSIDTLRGVERRAWYVELLAAWIGCWAGGMLYVWLERRRARRTSLENGSR